MASALLLVRDVIGDECGVEHLGSITDDCRRLLFCTNMRLIIAMTLVTFIVELPRIEYDIMFVQPHIKKVVVGT